MFRKAWYSLILAAAVAVAGALTDATAATGWLLTAALLTGLWWTIVFFKNDLNMGLVSAGTSGAGGGGGGGGRGIGERAQHAYYTQRTARLAAAPIAGGAAGLAALAGKGAAKTGTATGLGMRTGLGVAAGKMNGAGWKGAPDGAVPATRAVRELHAEHRSNASKLTAEKAKRSRIAELRQRQRIASEMPETGAAPLGKKEREELAMLEKSRMSQGAHDRMRTRHETVEGRKKDGKTPFTTAEVMERAERIAERDAKQANKRTADYNERTRPNGDGRSRDTDDVVASWRERASELADRAKRVRDANSSGGKK